MRKLFATVMRCSFVVVFLGSVGFCQDDREQTFEPYPLVETGDRVIAPPEGTHPFYKKYINAGGVVIVGSENVADEALIAARRLVLRLTSKRPDIHQALLKHHPRISVMAFSETASDLPEFGEGADGEWGLGQMPGDPTSLISEKGIRYEGNDEYIANFLMHEFVHMIHNQGIPEVDPAAFKAIYAAYLKAVEEGRFVKPPNPPRANASVAGEWRDDEYFTHSVNAYYDLNERLPGPWVDVQIGDWGVRSGTREELRKNDPVIFEIIEKFFPASLDED